MTSQRTPPNNFDLSNLTTLEHPWQYPHPTLPEVWTVELSLLNGAGIQINTYKLPFVFSEPDDAAVCAGRSFIDVFGFLCDRNTQASLQGGVAAITGNYSARLVDGSVGVVKVAGVPVVEIGDEPASE